MLKYSLLAFTMLATPAFAWNGTNNGNGQLVEQGTAVQNSARAHANASAGASAIGIGGAGGRGGSASARGGSSYSGGSSTTVQGSGNTSGGLGITTPEGFGVASCGGGIGLSGLGLGGGGSGGGTLWEFQECKIIREANALHMLGQDAAAVAELCEIDRVRKAFGGTCPSQQTTSIDVDDRPDFCFTRNAGDKNQHRECDLPPVVTTR